MSINRKRSDYSLTTEKTLHAGTPVWSKKHFRLRQSHLKTSIKADVAIIGAGVTGAFMAEALSRRYDNVVIVDRRFPAHGSTAASTAMLQWEIDTPLIELSDQIGAANARRAWQRSYRATQDLIRLVTDKKIRCGLGARDALYLAGNKMGSVNLERESHARNRAGLPGGYLNGTALKKTFGIERTGAILSPNSAIADPVALTLGLLRRAETNGAQLFFPVRVDDVLATPHGVVLDAGAHFIEARYCVFCTGYELLKGVPHKGVKIASTWAIATRPHTHRPAWLDRTLVWEASDPYLYIRTTPDGRLVIGGEDEDIDLPSYRSRSLLRKAARLEAKTKNLLPDLDFSTTYRWTGAFGESADGLPIIDAICGMPNCFAVMGVGGNGTIYSMIASQIIPSLLKGKHDKDAALFRFRD